MVKKHVSSGKMSCEGITFDWMEKNKLNGARPLISRIKFQPNNGVNFTQELCKQTNISMAYTNIRVPIDKFKVVNVDDNHDYLIRTVKEL